LFNSTLNGPNVTTNPALLNLALAQLATSLNHNKTPSIQTNQTASLLRPLQGATKPTPSPHHAIDQLKNTFHEHLRANNIAVVEPAKSAPTAPKTFNNIAVVEPAKSAPTASKTSNKSRAGGKADAGRKRSRAQEDQAAGFLSSLRDSYEQALATDPSTAEPPRTKDNEFTAANIQRIQSELPKMEDKRRVRPSTVTDTSSAQQAESSFEDSEDWNSDKNTDPDQSSSGDSNKDEKETNMDANMDSFYSRGPPRKRHKTSVRE
jgi:hypothetical protein